MNKVLPVDRPKKKARRFYDRVSTVYDWLAASEQEHIHKAVNKLPLKPGDKILDVGSGTGNALAWIAEKLSATGQVVGVDISHRMLQGSRAKIIRSTPKPHLVQGDGANLPLQSSSFNGIFCAFTLELFSVDEIPVVLNEFQRVLQPGGFIAVLSLVQEPRSMAIRIYELAHQLFPVIVDCRPIPLVNFLEQSGFSVIETYKETNWGLPLQIAIGKAA